MIINVPEPKDFSDTGRELLDFAWDIVANLLTQLDEAEYFGIDPSEISDTYWTLSRRRLTTALSISQQGVEFIIKGRISKMSPFILFADPPSKWPNPTDEYDQEYSQFRTIDSQDLIKVHDTFSENKFDANFIEAFNGLRKKRNTIMHSFDSSLDVEVSGVVTTILEMHKHLFPHETWGQMRLEFLEKSPDTEFGSLDWVQNIVCREMSIIFDLLSPAKLKKYFNTDGKQRRYFCPDCYNNANHDAGFEYKLAILIPKSPTTTTIYCPICNKNYAVYRKDCSTKYGEDICKGNVISKDHDICLTCGNG